MSIIGTYLASLLPEDIMKNFLSALIILALLLIFMLGGCDSRNPTQSSNYSISVSADKDTIDIGSDLNYCTIRASLTLDGEAVENAQVNFSTSMGEILGSGTTNSIGFAETIFWYNGSATGVATIRASYSGADDTVKIYIVDEFPFILTVWSEPDYIVLGSGNYSTDIFAYLTDRDGMGIANAQIGFESDSGFISPSQTTNDNGYAQSVYIYAGSNPEMIEIRASYQGAIAINSIEVIELDIINLTVWAEPDTIFEGTSQNYSEIYAKLTDSFDNPISDVQINFSASLGSILSSAITNTLGIANTAFWYDERPDITAIITASYQDISANTSVTILTSQPQIVFLQAEPLVIYADNDPDTYSVITARVLDSAGDPQPGLVVTFQTSIGYLIQPYAETNNSGYASSQLHDNGIPGTATVYVYCENDQSQIDVQIVPQ
jgi:hypothetical protein